MPDEKVARAIASAYARRAWPHKSDVIDKWVNKSFRTFFDEARAALAVMEREGVKNSAEPPDPTPLTPSTPDQR